MTVKEFIQGQFSDFGVSISDASVFKICLLNKLQEKDEITEGNLKLVEIAVVRTVPDLLLRQGIDKSTIKRWCDMKCRDLGIKSVFPHVDPSKYFPH